MLSQLKAFKKVNKHLHSYFANIFFQNSQNRACTPDSCLFDPVCLEMVCKHVSVSNVISVCNAGCTLCDSVSKGHYPVTAAQLSLLLHHFFWNKEGLWAASWPPWLFLPCKARSNGGTVSAVWVRPHVFWKDHIIVLYFLTKNGISCIFEYSVSLNVQYIV